MAASKKNAPQPDPDRLTAEFSSGQLIIAICVTLLFTLSVFLIGVLVGKYQKYDTIKTTQAQADTTALKVETESASETPPAQANEAKGAQTTPRNPIQERLSAPPQRRNTINPYATPTTRTPPPRTVELPPLPGAASKNNAPLRISKQSSPKTATTPPVQAKPLKPAPTPEKVTPAAPATPAPTKVEVKTPAPPVKPQVAKPSTPVAPAPRPKPVAPAPKPVLAGTPPTTGFGIQLASFLGPDRKVRAQEYLTRLKKNANITAVMLPSSDAKSCRIVITGYADKASATAACTELKKKAGFADAWVRSFP